MRDKITINGKPFRLQQPNVLDKAGIGNAISAVDVDYPRVLLGVLGLCVVQGPARRPREPLADFGERVWTWLAHACHVTDAHLKGVLGDCQALLIEIFDEPQTPSDERVQDARDFSPAGPENSPDAGLPSGISGTPSNG